MDSRYRLFKKGQLVVDLGYAPGSWSQVAMERTKPGGRVLGIDVIPAQPPPGVATIQGNFLSPVVQGMVKQFVVDVHRLQARDRARAGGAGAAGDDAGGGEADDCVEEKQSYIDMERHSVAEEEVVRAAISAEDGNDCEGIASPRAADASKGTQDKKLVDVSNRTCSFCHCVPKTALHEIDDQELTAEHPPTDSDKRHVRTMAPNHRLLE